MKSSIICLLLANVNAIKLLNFDDEMLHMEIDDTGLEASISDLTNQMKSENKQAVDKVQAALADVSPVISGKNETSLADFAKIVDAP